MWSIPEVIAFAARAHAGQRRLDAARTPYINHPIRVAEILAKSHHGQSVIAAAYMHDVVEDCGVAIEEVLDRFGNRIAFLVAMVTDDKSLPKAERKRLQVERASKTTDGDVIALKIADKIANVEDLIERPPAEWSRDRVEAYVAWANEVVNAFPERYVDGELWEMFEEVCKRFKAKAA